MTFSANGAEYETENVTAGDGWQTFELIAPPPEKPPATPALPSDNAAPDLVEAFWPHLPLLRKYLRRRVPVADLDDIPQDVLLRILRRADAAAVAHPTCYLFQPPQAAPPLPHRPPPTPPTP